MFELIYRFDPNNPRPRQTPASAHEACERLKSGNESFAQLAANTTGGAQIIPFDLEDIGIVATGGAPKQQPFAVVLGCSDARVPVELIFDRSCNELFVVRVAGNILGQEQLGSIDYAVSNLGQNLKALVVLGHSQCGAVTAAVDSFLKPGEYLSLAASHHVRAIVNSLFPAVRGAAAMLTNLYGHDVVQRTGYRAALIELAVIFNAALMANILHTEFIKGEEDRRVVFGVYDLCSRRVQVPGAGRDSLEPQTRLLSAPTCQAEMRDFASHVANSATIRMLLAGH